MKNLTCLIDTARDLLTPFRECFKQTNKVMAEYEQKIADKEIKKRVRKARLKLNTAIGEYNKAMEQLR